MLADALVLATRLAPGGAGGEPVFTEGTVGRAYLSSHGVPPEAVIVENEGESTVQSTTSAIEIMTKRRISMNTARSGPVEV